MNDPVALVRTRILALSAVTTLVVARVYSGILRQSALLPAVAIQLIDRIERSQLRGGGKLLQARVQVHSVGSTRESALALANAIEGDGTGSGVAYFQGFVGAVKIHAIFPGGTDREEYRSDPSKEWEVIRDYLVHFDR